MNFFKIISIFIFLFSNLIFSQIEVSKDINGIIENNQIDNNEKIIKLQNLLNSKSNALEKGILLSKIGELYSENKNKEKAKELYLKAIGFLEKYKKSHLNQVNEIRFSLANLYKEDNRKEYYLIIKQIVDDKGNDIITINSIAILAKKGDYYTGINKLNILLLQNNSINKELYIRKTIIKIYAYMHESDFNIKLKSDLKIIEEHQKKMEDIFYKSTLNEVFIYGVYNNLANIYDAFGEIDTALNLYTKAKEFYKKNNEIEKMLDVTNNLGYLYSRKKDTYHAKLCFQEVINKSTDEYQLATAYDNMGFFLKSNNSKDKIAYFQKAVQIILKREVFFYTTPSLKTVRESGYQQDVLIFLIDLADQYVKTYKETKEKKYLHNAKETLYLIDDLVSLIRYQSSTEQSKLFWIEKGVNTYLLAVEVCFLLDKPDEAFYFIEKNKALLLQENIKVFQAKLELEIPKRIQEREYKLHYELQAIQKQIQNNSDDALLKLKYTTKSKNFHVFMDSLRKKYPEYAKVKLEIETVNLNKVINFLKDDECFITYILNENNGYGLFCNQREKIFFKIDNIATFQNEVKVLKNLMRQRLLSKDKTLEFQKLSNNIFNSLFPFKNTFSKIKGKKMVIVPDDSLLDLPFEALSINTKQSLSKSYLIHYTEISYLQSFSVFEKIKQKLNHPTKKILAIAPYQFKDKKLPDLIRSKEAMSALNVYRSSEILIGEKATKENFYTKSKDFEILHLNTHAGIDIMSESPWISFRNDKLTLDELYGINSQAELVILDACKTNDGKFASGEGILSLSRGFFNNGSKSVLASLWNVNEKAGNDIIATFYNELEKGKSKSRALQLAKINYLKEHQFSEVLPYYWASFTLTGSTEPIELSESYFQGIPLLIIVLSTLLILGFIYYKRKVFFSK